MTTDNYISLIKEWAKERGIDKARPEKQMLKLMEEAGELAEGLAKGNEDEVIDSIGDVFVVLVILSQQLNLDFHSCVEEAYNTIKSRKGKTINGIFVKQEDI